MKTKLILSFILLPFMLLANNDLLYYLTNNNKIEEQKPTKKRRYRLDDKAKNFFHLENDEIRIEVPVTSGKLKITNWVANISSDSLNAVLIWIKTRGISYTECDGEYRTKSKKIKISKLRGLKRQMRQRTDKKLLVVFWVDEKEPDYQLENSYRELVRKANSYDDAVEKVNIGNCDGEEALYKYWDILIKPAESGGDVIGGNG